MILKIPIVQWLIPNPVGLVGEVDRDHYWSAGSVGTVAVGEVPLVVVVG